MAQQSSSRETLAHIDQEAWIRMIIAALFVIAKNKMKYYCNNTKVINKKKIDK